jgi:hypothetical protein
MLNFNVDLTEVAMEFDLQKEDISALCDYTLDRVVDEFVNKWESLIDSTLNSTRDEYKRAIYTDRPDDHTAIIGLVARESKLAIMLEEGADVFDEKFGFQNSSKKHIKKSGQGWYLTIPFRHATSESIMQLQTPSAGVSVIDLMKTGQTLSGDNLPAPFNQIQTHSIPLNNGTIITYKHKAHIYEGMHRRDISSTQKEKRGGYFTFRRVSDKSDPAAFMHPGFAAHKFMDKVLQDSALGQAVDSAVQDWLDVKFG